MRYSTGYFINGKYIKSDTIDDVVKKGKEHSNYRDHVRKEMARDYSRDLIQQSDPQFVDAFPDKAKRMGMIPESEG